MAEGYIKLYRKIVDNWVWEETPFSKGQAWIDLIMMANHKESKIVFGGRLITLEAGQLVTSEVKLAKRWGWSRQKARSFLATLQHDEMIDKKSDSKKTTITLCNYRAYSDSENSKQTAEKQQTDSKKTAEKQQKNTDKNVKNDKNDKNDKKESTRFTPPTLDEIKNYCVERGNSVDPQKFYDYFSTPDGWIDSTGKPVRNWKQKIITWETKNNDRRYSPPAKVVNYESIPQEEHDRLQRLLKNIKSEGSEK